MPKKMVYVTLQQFCQQGEEPLRTLREAGLEVLVNSRGHRLGREELVELLPEADAVIAGVEPYDAELLERLPRLRCISRCGVGTESIDLMAARRRGITVLTTPDEVTEPVAQMTVAMILALARNLPLHLNDSRRGEWKKRTGVLLCEWKIGLIGFGRIGRAVERCLRPFGPKILVTDPVLSPNRPPSGVEALAQESLLAQADLVSLHASPGEKEGPLIGREEIALMKRGAYLVNTARGFLVDEAALLEALERGALAGAALDVFEEEPYRGPLSQLPQVLCTPHVSTLTRSSRAAMEMRSALNVVEFFSSCLQASRS
ncbi:MAG: phosphoglycerate dehydrogenase [Candidatus Omnitrophica bacterium]|nr:phosphoglycerate dehydrogenase [Candidatus Omnitrophota bacterium]